MRSLLLCSASVLGSLPITTGIAHKEPSTDSTSSLYSYHGGRFSIPVVRPVTPNLKRDDDKDSIPLDSSYLINATIGTPPQSFLFLGDTGSVNLAVGSTLLPKNKQSSSPKYNPKSSSSAKQVDGYTYKSCFVSGYCSEGLVYQDVFTLGDLVVEDQHFGVQTNNTDIGSGQRSGTLGLDFDKNGQTTKPEKVPSWLETIMPRLESALFTVNFNQETSDGAFDFGYIDKTKYKGDIVYASADHGGGGWLIEYNGVRLVNGTVAAKGGWLATVDTGTSTAALQSDVAAAYFSQIKEASYDSKQGRYTFPCSSDMVDFTFVIGSSDATIPASHMNAGSLDGGKTCHSKLIVNDHGQKVIWGQPFIEEFLIVFDWDNSKVGFGQKYSADNSSSSSTAPSSSASGASTSSAPSSTGTGDSGSIATSKRDGMQSIGALVVWLATVLFLFG